MSRFLPGTLLQLVQMPCFDGRQACILGPFCDTQRVRIVSILCRALEGTFMRGEARKCKIQIAIHFDMMIVFRVAGTINLFSIISSLYR